MWFGNLAGLFGTIVAAMIFAAFLFHPTSSLKVKDSAQRSSLIWMIVGGIAMSELLGVRLNRGHTSEQNGYRIAGIYFFSIRIACTIAVVD